jgi:Xaa-Pro dipeptidase
MPPINYTARQDRLRALAAEANVPAVALVPGANMVYFTGLHVHLSERPTLALIRTDGQTDFILPALESAKLTQMPFAVDNVYEWTDADGYMGAFRGAAGSLQLAGGWLGIDDNTMRVFEWLAFSEAAPGVHPKPMGTDLLGLRAIKTATEINLIRQAITLSETALSQTLDTLRKGMSEREIAEALSAHLRANGSHGHAFSPLVLVGENSALPHGVSGPREVRPTDIVLIDFGGTVDGYPADITRTFVYGLPTDQIRDLYEVVYQANEAARAIVRPGVTCDAVDWAAREVIEAAGYGDYFIHRTGHGLGLEVHELPQIASGNPMPLAEGMVFTIEPGVYLPGVGGVRLEDVMVVSADGAESLTTFPRALTSI